MMPQIRVLGDRKYQLLEEHAITWTHGEDLHVIRVPEGFICDGNSVPWFGRPLIPGDWTLGLDPVLVHDFIYYRRGRLRINEHMVKTPFADWTDALDFGDGFRQIWLRRDADRLFARLMRDAGVPRWRRRLAFRAVRLARWNDWAYDIWGDEDD